MKKENVLVFLIIAILIFSVLYLIINNLNFTGNTIKEEQKCLSEIEFVFYFSQNCPDCMDMANIFGKKESVIDCGLEFDKCSFLEKIPAVEMDNKIYYNLSDIENINFNC